MAWKRATCLRWLLSLALLLALAGAGGCRKEAQGPEEYSDEAFHVSFFYPRSFARLTPSGHWLARWEGPGDIRIFLHAARDESFFFSSGEHDFFEFMGSFKKWYPLFYMGDSAEKDMGGRKGRWFSAAWGEDAARGFYAKDGMYEYCLVAAAPEGRAGEAERLLSEILSRAVFGDKGADEKKLLAKIRGGEHGSSAAGPENRLAYGRELLKNRALSVENYDRAAREFNMVLADLYEKDPGSADYADALRMLEITRAFQEQDFHVHRFELMKALGLSDRDRSFFEIHYILKLVPNRDDPRHRFADRMFAAARKIK